MNTRSTVTQNCDVVVVGEYYCDLIFHNLCAVPQLGKEVVSEAFDTVAGGSFTPAMSLARLGFDVMWHCGLGTDPYSVFIRNEAAAAGIGNGLFQELDQPLRRVTTVFSTDGDRGFMTFIDGPDPIVDVEKALSYSPKFILFQGLTSVLANIDLAKQARARGIVVIADCGHIETTLDDDAVRAAIGSVDIFMPNSREACQLTGEADVEKSLLALGGIVSDVVIKTGADGAVGLINGQVKRVSAKVVNVVDTTGAGDSFNAGFLYGLLKGKSYEDAMGLGTLNGSISTTDLGGRAVPNEAQIIAEWTAFRTK